MFGEKDLCNGLVLDGENSVTKPSKPLLERYKENPDEKTGFSGKGLSILREREENRDGFVAKPKKSGNLGTQELTLSYLCDNPNMSFLDKDFPPKFHSKGKEVVTAEDSEKWVERDFLNLNETRVNSSSKREAEPEDDVEKESREKKPKLETLNLSLALPDVSLSLTASNAHQNHNKDPQAVSLPAKPTRSVQSLTQNTYSNDFTAPSLSYSYSHPFSHNPSCSLTRNSTENCDYSVGRDDQIWNCGEGTNGSVHSRFKPIGDGVALLNGNRNKDVCPSSFYRTTSSDNNSFFPSELPARPRIDTQSGDSRGRGSDQLRALEDGDAGKGKKLSRPERIVLEIVSESVSSVSQMVQELPAETLELVKDYLRNLFQNQPEKKEELLSLQGRLKRRSDLTNETLLKCHKDQLDILVAVKTGLEIYLLPKNHRIAKPELVEIFLSMRCRNVNCKSALPVDDCDCKICTSNEGFCSSCMCPVCLTFDCANNTCSWVGCDVCSHWCHAACGIQRNLIKPGPSLKGRAGTTEMQFHCIGCGHASEMFGFVKDVFLCCAKDWGADTLKKELDCVRRIFRGSDDYKGMELHQKAEEMINKLESRVVTPADACNFIIQFFNNADSMSDLPAAGASSKDITPTQSSLRKDAISIQPSSCFPPKHNLYHTSSSGLRSDVPSHAHDLRQNVLKASLLSALTAEDELQLRKPSKKDDFDSLESIVRIKEAEARMFQSKADEARKEAERYRQIIQAKTEKLDEEYAEKLGKLCLQETEERRRKKLEELKLLENSHCDYYGMKMRMQAEIAGLLERMEATKKQWV